MKHKENNKIENIKNNIVLSSINAINETDIGNIPKSKIDELNKSNKNIFTNENDYWNNLDIEKNNRCIIF